MTELDLTRLPKGQREWAEFIAALGMVDDRAERYFLELKSDVDLTTEPGRAKVAKFILGAANRLPERAARRFGGHALLVLGVAKDAVTGIPFFEAKDLERTVRKFASADAPGWDFERIRVDAVHDVIVVVVDPPRHGDPVWTCHKDGPENLKDGGIYVRTDGETREAKGDEVRVLLNRARQVRHTADLAVTIVGSAIAAPDASAALDQYRGARKQQLLDAYRDAHRKASGYSDIIVSQIVAATMRPEPRTYDKYVAEIERWEEQLGESWPEAVDDVVSRVWPCVRVRIQNLRRTFLEGVELTIHLNGEVRGLHRVQTDDAGIRKLPAQPRTWGPQALAESLLWRDPSNVVQMPYFPPVANDGNGSVSFTNGGSVDLTLPLRELRPEGTFESSNGLVLVVDDPTLKRIEATWRATARGHHDVYEGALSVAVDREHDLGPAIRKMISPGLNEDHDGSDDRQD
ncbi:hypothetical protein [Amycolatopsis pithecellobii]|uniref:Uncharacterized protein n=1 Tax=Amycolatopsis pithecellobii TaxID=664692 RepID=A0A6N7Z2F0_9PSEU|nr:hypothetical protein [Amycolatopsis pithecellobii]MTD54070.1 hypothetical protein [Amycolatopsis pithecellobii]